MPIVDNVTPAQQSRALWLSTVAFTTCFAVWTIFSIIGLQIQKDLGLSETEFGLLVGTPILSGSLIRLILGIWSDQYGGRIIYTIVMVTAAIATFLLTTVDTYVMYLVAALGIGIAGGAFAVGNVGASVTKFTAPFVMVASGWHAGKHGEQLCC